MATTGGQISNRKAARRANLTPGYVGRVMSGKRMPRLDTANRIAQGKNLTLDQLYTIIVGRRAAAKSADRKSGINPARKAAAKVRKSGGHVEAPVTVTVDQAALKPITPRDTFEMFGGQHVK